MRVCDVSDVTFWISVSTIWISVCNVWAIYYLNESVFKTTNMCNILVNMCVTCVSRTYEWGCVTSQLVGLKLERVPESPTGLVKHTLLGTLPQSFWIRRSGVGPKNMRSDDPGTAGLGTTFWELLFQVWVIPMCGISVSWLTATWTHGRSKWTQVTFKGHMYHLSKHCESYTSPCNIGMMCEEHKWTSVCLQKHLNKHV